MAIVGDKAKVVSSTGFISKRFVGQTGIAVMRLTATAKKLWVIRFSSGLQGDEEGLYADDELDWTRG